MGLPREDTKIALQAIVGCRGKRGGQWWTEGPPRSTCSSRGCPLHQFADALDWFSLKECQQSRRGIWIEKSRIINHLISFGTMEYFSSSLIILKVSMLSLMTAFHLSVMATRMMVVNIVTKLSTNHAFPNKSLSPSGIKSVLQGRLDKNQTLHTQKYRR